MRCKERTVNRIIMERDIIKTPKYTMEDCTKDKICLSDRNRESIWLEKIDLDEFLGEYFKKRAGWS